VARVVFKVVSDENTRLLKFLKGDLRLGVNVLPLDKLERFAGPPLDGQYAVLEGPGLSFQYLGFNLEDSLLARPGVRRAIAHAIDVDALIEHRQKGHSVRATGLFPPGSPYHDPGLQPIAYDPALAGRLLDEAGFPLAGNRRFTLTYKTTTDRSAVVQARVIQSDLRKVGIEVEVRSYEWATFYEDIKRGNFQVYSLRWIGVSDPGFLYELLHSAKVPPGGRNRGRFRDPALDALLDKARVEPDPARRRALYREVHRAAFAALPYLPLWHNNNLAVVSRALEGFTLHPSGGFEHLAEARWKAP
jgi:peptide/nickel transport system substrate-binding protein